MLAIQSFIEAITQNRKFLLRLLLLQIPAATLSLVTSIFEPELNHLNPIIATVCIFPLFSFLSIITNAATFEVISKNYSIKLASQSVKNKLKPLFIASLVVGLIYALSLAAFVLPLIYFMALYLYVPIIIMTSEPMAVTTALFRSKTVANSALTSTLIISFINIIILFASFFLTKWINHYYQSIDINTIAQSAAEYSTDFTLSLFTGVVIDTWVVTHFLKIQDKHEKLS